MSQPKQNAAAGADEIDQIMSEIEGLQKEMASTQPVVAAATAELQAQAAPVAPAAAATSNDDLMAEFKSSGDDVSLEGTLSELDSSGPSSGTSLLDQVDTPSADAVTPEAAAPEAAELGTAEAELQALEAQVEAASQQVEHQLEVAAEAAAAAEKLEASEEILEEATPAEEPVSDADFQAAAAEVEAEMREQMEESGMPPKESARDSGTMEMTLQGDMTLRIRYQFEGQEVVVAFHDHALHVQLSDGTEFKIPVARRPAGLRRVA
jgi:hypothetical protein